MERGGNHDRSPVCLPTRPTRYCCRDDGMKIKGYEVTNKTKKAADDLTMWINRKE